MFELGWFLLHWPRVRSLPIFFHELLCPVVIQALVGTGPMSSDTLLDWIDEINKLLERDVRNITHYAGDSVLAVYFLYHPTPL